MKRVGIRPERRKLWRFGGAERNALHLLCVLQCCGRTSVEERPETGFCVQVLQDKPLGLAALTQAVSARGLYVSGALPSDVPCGRLGAWRVQSKQPGSNLTAGPEGSSPGLSNPDPKNPDSPNPGSPQRSCRGCSLLAWLPSTPTAPVLLAALCGASPRCPF